MTGINEALRQRYYHPVHLSSRSGAASRLSARLNSLGLGSLQVVRRNPALVVGLRSGGDSRAISANNADLIGRVDLLGPSRRALGALTTLSATLLLREEGGDPGVVDEVAGSGEDAKEDEVEEDARVMNWYGKTREYRQIVVDSHLRVKERGRGLDDGDGLVEDLLGEDRALRVLNHGSQVQGQVLGVHLSCEAIGQSFLLASRDHDIVASRSQVANNDRRCRSAWSADWSHKGTTNEKKVDGLDLVVCD